MPAACLWCLLVVLVMVVIRYIAPEVLRGARYGFAVDMWSVGVILFTLLCGSCPFYHQDEVSQQASRQQAKLPPIHPARPASLLPSSPQTHS